MKKPIIGIIPDYKIGGANSYSRTPFYAIRQNYLHSISDAGGVPIVFSYDYRAIEQYLNLIDGLLFIGGGFDVNPKRYNEEKHTKTTLNEMRDNFEFEVLSKVIKYKSQMPILGICNGMQLINIFFGGSCIQHIPDHSEYMNHEQSHNLEFLDYQPYHQIEIFSNKLIQIGGQKIIKTNSSHHQAIGKLGENIVVGAKASDGIIEAIEHSKHPFCLGVQWHPEFENSGIDRELFLAFINATKIKN